jgi:glyoxylase-like metal-dependent hydrolase (beta-lactamase superfamily II)
MEIRLFTFNPFQTNGYVCHDGGEAVVVDPSCATPDEQREMMRYVDANDLEIAHLLLTHAHVDHIFGCHFFEEQTGMRFKAHEESVAFIERSVEQAKAFGVEVEPPSTPETFLEEGDTVSFGDVTLEVLHTPGHSPDSISFVHRESDQALTGDVLFQRSIGRTQGLPKTSYPQLMDSIINTLLPLGDEMTIYPGHGPKTTIGQERRSNPFIQEEMGTD